MKFNWGLPTKDSHKTHVGGSGLDRDEAPMNDPNGEARSPFPGYNSSNNSSGGGGGGSRKTYQVLNDGTEDAEDSILSNLEAQSKLTRVGSDGFRPAIPGERAPLGVDSVGTALGAGDDDKQPPAIRRPTFKQMAKRVQAVQRLRKVASNRSLNSSRASSQDETAIGHRRAKTLLASIDEANAIRASGGGDDPLHGNRDHELFTDFRATNILGGDRAPNEEYEGLQFLWHENDEDDVQLRKEAANVSSDLIVSGETQPLLSDVGGRGNGSGRDDGGTTTLEDVVAERRRLAQQRRIELRWKRLRDCLNPIKMIQRLVQVLVSGTFVMSIPMFVVSAILFYYVGNPELDFMPGKATISWWLNFFGRQLLVFELARLTEFILIDVFTMSSRAVVQLLGPWVTIFCLQSKGWPFLVTFWGLYDLLLLHGDNPFQTHWFYWTGIRIYSSANSGSYILNSSVYLRVLIGMILAGVASTLKRTLLTLYFGKRSFDVYKPKLEEILNDIIVITEVAELGGEADNLEDSENQVNAKQLLEVNLKRRGQLAQVRWSSVKFQNGSESRSRAASVDSTASPLVTGESGYNEGDGSLLDSPLPERAAKDPVVGSPPRSIMSRTAAKSFSSGHLRIKNLLDRWEEPVNKLDKATDSTVNDILKFRKALTYMDLEHPFGEAFGPASTREELLDSAQRLYRRLLKLSPGSMTLPYSVLTVLTENEDGTFDKNLKKSIENLFRPDADGEIAILAFIQTCDVVYRKLRYFRASVGNASVIDKVLEGIIDGIYSFGLTVVILSLLNFNPWPLLVSVSTLLVSFAFAIGPTAAKAIEGILMIVGTRPFDIGDRIIIANTPGLPTPGMGDSWFVEDITLFSTTLRLGANNEVATVTNGAIAATRITNCARSKNAVVDILLKLHISMHEGHNVDRFKDGLENYISDNPATWDSLVYLRCEQIDSDDESVKYRLAARSRHSWQVASRILADRGRLHQFCVELSKKMGVNFDSPTMRSVMYYGGNLVDGAVKDFKKNLLMDRSNIASRADFDMFGSSRGGSERPSPIRIRTSSAIERPSSDGVATDNEATPPTSSSPADDLFLAMIQHSQQ